MGAQSRLGRIAEALGATIGAGAVLVAGLAVPNDGPAVRVRAGTPGRPVGEGGLHD